MDVILFRFDGFGLFSYCVFLLPGIACIFLRLYVSPVHRTICVHITCTVATLTEQSSHHFHWTGHQH